MELEELQKTLQEKDMMIADLTKRITELTARIDVLEQDSEGHLTVIEVLKTQLGKEQEERKQMENKIESMKHDHERKWKEQEAARQSMEKNFDKKLDEQRRSMEETFEKNMTSQRHFYERTGTTNAQAVIPTTEGTEKKNKSKMCIIS